MIYTLTKLSSCWLALSLLGACAQLASTTTNVPAPTPIQSPSVQPTGCPPATLEKQIAEIARVTQGPVGAGALLIETGETVAFHGDDHFPMQSVYKLAIAMALLRQVDKGTLTLDQKVKVSPDDFVSRREFTIAELFPKGAELTVRELLHFMISESDGTACDVLMRLVGGPTEVTKYLRELGIEGIVVANYEKEMAADASLPPQNSSTPKAMLDLLKLVHEGPALSAASRRLLLDLMTNSRPGPRRIKGLLPKGTSVAHKTGTGRVVNGMATATNDVGLITLPDGRHLAVAIFVSNAKGDEATREGVIAKITKAAWDCWTVK